MTTQLLDDKDWMEYEQFVKDYKEVTAFDRYHWAREYFGWLPEPIKQLIELIKNFYRFEKLCDKYKDTQNRHIVKHLLRESPTWLVTVSDFNRVYWTDASRRLELEEGKR